MPDATDEHTRPALEFREAVVQYGPVRALDGLTLSLPEGGWLGVLGANGAGKSTLVRAATGIAPLAAGEARLFGRAVERLSPGEIARAAAVVPQLASVPFPYTALELVLMGRAPHLGWLGLEGEPDHRRARAALERTGTLHLAGRPLETLSGGERQRVFLARAIAQDAPLLLLDEPTTHLDIAAQTEALDLVRALHREGRSVLTVLHDLNLAALYCPQVALLRAGRVLALGPPAEVLTAGNLRAAYGAPVALTTHPVSGSPVVLPLPGGRPEQ